jgi:hypothetical protein
MQARAASGETYLLNAIVERKASPQLRTEMLSSVNMVDLLDANPAAITLAPHGTSSGELLLDLFIEKSRLFRPLFKSPTRTSRWMLYISGHGQFEFKKSIERKDLAAKQFRIFLSSVEDLSIAALVPEVPWTTKRKDAIRVALTEVMMKPAIPSGSGRLTRDEATAASNDDDDEAWDREMLIRVRRQMLNQVGSYSSEELATGAESTTTNASQYAADQREAGKIFGVRFGQAWHYPKFQFDPKRRPYPEMKAIIAALPDDQGWDRVQWFLEPHERLRGKTPLQVWKTDRKKVIEAANMERWNARL